MAHKLSDAEQTLISELVRPATFAADAAAMQAHPTNAARTAAIVRQVLEMCVANDLITLVELADWPETVVLDPPYDISLP